VTARFWPCCPLTAALSSGTERSSCIRPSTSSHSHGPKPTMDRPPPYQRPPDRPMNYHPQALATQAYPGYPPASQPQQPLHVPYAVDPYSIPRRDPFYPSAPQHGRHSSQGLPGGNNAPQGQAEEHIQGQQGGWANLGTDFRFTFFPRAQPWHRVHACLGPAGYLHAAFT
jgi:hypothetical protein